MLRYRADIRTLCFVATYFGLVAVQWLYRPTALWVAIPLVVLTCFFSFFGAVITHNTIHCPMFHSQGLNRLMQVVLTCTYGHPVSSFVPGHNLSHHRFTQSRRDVMRTSKVRFRWNLLNGLLFMFRMVPSIMRADSAYAKAMFRRHPKWFRQLLLELGALYVAMGLLLWLDWQAFLLYVFLPHRYAGWGIITMNLLQHDGCDGESAHNHSRNFVSGIVNWFTFNNGYHSIHHVKASLHWSLLPEAHAEKVAPFIHPALDQPSLVGYLWRTFIWPGRRLKYDGTPIILPDEGPDESWIPAPHETPKDVSLGAVS